MAVAVSVLLLTAPGFASGKILKLSEEMQALQSSQPYASLSLIEYQELAYPVAVTIDRNDPTYNFGFDGISRFKAYMMPDCPKFCRLVINSYEMPLDAPRDGVATAFFFPQITLVDANFRVIWGSEDGEAVFTEPSAHETEKLELVVDLKKFPQARYILLHTGHQALMEGGDYHSYDPGVTVSAGSAFVTVGERDAFFHVLGSPVASGTVDIRIDDSDPRPYGDLDPPFPME